MSKQNQTQEKASYPIKHAMTDVNARIDTLTSIYIYIKTTQTISMKNKN